MNILKKLTTIMVVGAIFAVTQNVYAILLTIDVPENISELRFTTHGRVLTFSYNSTGSIANIQLGGDDSVVDNERANRVSKRLVPMKSHAATADQWEGLPDIKKVRKGGRLWNVGYRVAFFPEISIMEQRFVDFPYGIQEITSPERAILHNRVVGFVNAHPDHREFLLGDSRLGESLEKALEYPFHFYAISRYAYERKGEMDLFATMNNHDDTINQVGLSGNNVMPITAGVGTLLVTASTAIKATTIGTWVATAGEVGGYWVGGTAVGWTVSYLLPVGGGAMIVGAGGGYALYKYLYRQDTNQELCRVNNPPMTVPLINGTGVTLPSRGGESL
jgi:hypothetical protein